MRMAETSVKIMQCALANSEIIKIDRVGVGIILFSQSKKIGIGIHTLVLKHICRSRERLNMKIKCPGCGKVYNIPEERLPFRETVSVSVPCM